jgi:hypothetical protein
MCCKKSQKKYFPLQPEGMKKRTPPKEDISNHTEKYSPTKVFPQKAF